MMVKMGIAFAVVAACLVSIATTPSAYSQTARRTVTVKHPPIGNPGDTSWSPQQNIIDSKRYEQMLRTNPAFRKARMQKECGGITIPELRESCLASFNQG
jgi:hypothetical protein